MEIREGYMPFLEYKTYYRVVGKNTGNKKPLVLLHGGPGSTHNYFEVLWNSKVWIEELIELRKHLGLDEIHLLGQSWGGMQTLEYVCNYKPEGLKSIILSSTLPASWLWAEEAQRMIAQMPQDMQDAIKKATESGDYSSPEYQAAEAEYMRQHCAGEVTENDPECLRRPKKAGRESYVVGWGPNEFTPLGTLKDYDVIDQLGDIKEPALIINGGNDLCTPYVAKFMYDRIPNSEWELFRTCRHMCFVEDNDHYVEVLKKWMNKND